MNAISLPVGFLYYKQLIITQNIITTQGHKHNSHIDYIFLDNMQKLTNIIRKEVELFKFLY